MIVPSDGWQPHPWSPLTCPSVPWGALSSLNITENGWMNEQTCQ